MATAKVIQITEPSNGGKEVIDHSQPYAVAVTVQGSADFLFHRWNAEAVDEKAKAAKNSKGKKTDDVESYVYRTEGGELAIPGEYMRGSIINAAKFRQDPRSPRKSAMDLFKASIVVTSPAPRDAYGLVWEHHEQVERRNRHRRFPSDVRAVWDHQVRIGGASQGMPRRGWAGRGGVW